MTASKISGASSTYHVACPFCGSQDIRNKGIDGSVRRFSCNDCGKGFSTKNAVFTNVQSSNVAAPTPAPVQAPVTTQAPVQAPTAAPQYVCPHCGSTVSTGKGKNASGTVRRLCKNCGKGFSCQEITAQSVSAPITPSTPQQPIPVSQPTPTPTTVVHVESMSEEKADQTRDKFPIITVNDLDYNGKPKDPNKPYTFQFMNLSNGGLRTEVRGTWNEILPTITGSYNITGFNTGFNSFTLQSTERQTGTKG